MKVTVLSGSPRKTGDGARVAGMLQDAIGRLTPVEMKTLHLSDQPAPACRGCMACINRGEGLCPHKDWFQGIAREMDEADAVVLSSPVYAHQVSAGFKNVVDHGAYLFHRPRFCGKPAIILATSAGSGISETLKYLNLVATGWGYYVAGKVGATCNWYFDSDPGYQARLNRAVERAAHELVRVVGGGRRPSLTWNELYLFSGLRMKARQSECDTQYWSEKGWFKRDYFTDVQANPLKNLAAKSLEHVGEWYIQRSFAKKGLQQKKDS